MVEKVLTLVPYRRLGWVEHPPVREPPPAAIPAAAVIERLSLDRKRSWAMLIKKVYLDDPQLCRSCHQPMKTIAAIAPKQEQIDDLYAIDSIPPEDDDHQDGDPRS